MVTDVLDESAPENWHKVVFAFSEMARYYLAGEGPDMSREQVAAAAFVSCVLADAARANECDWGLQHQKVTQLNALLASRMDLDPEDLLPVTAYIYGKGGQFPLGDLTE